MKYNILNNKDKEPKTESVCSEESEEFIDAELGLSEDHFSRPEGYFGYSATEELEMAIENCKDMILETSEKSEKRKKLVMKLIQLRLKLQEIKEGEPVPETDVKVVMGHKFELRHMERSHQYCDKCCKVIWGVLNGWLHCKNCSFKCHNKCFSFLTRTCAYLKVTENPSYIMDICPEVGLASQCYKCAECKRKLLNKEGYHSPRICDYNGHYYCSFCHWNSQSIIPARVIHNWDFEPRKVCRASLQFLRLMKRKPILNLKELNPMLFSFVEDLNKVKKLREEILLMKKYFLSCHVASQGKLLLQLKTRQHFVENADVYSIKDLIDLHSGVLIEYLQNVYSIFTGHITKECEGCRGKGFICEVCKEDEVIFPFEDRTSSCTQCYTVFHKECYMKRKSCCPKCERRAKQNSQCKNV
ncbi:differentially expressed in FDCP 8 homolog isoform X2 [Tachypleus tridentatus]|uniref:differentially expressed in FDCP 8 homolog isoform X2 n=1 Tax=Tachypleus tridentatus TaxID=6853 RepID=UPI003FCEFE81